MKPHRPDLELDRINRQLRKELLETGNSPRISPLFYITWGILLVFLGLVLGLVYRLWILFQTMV